MDFTGTVMILVGIYLLTSAIKNRRPVELAKAVIRNPNNARALTQQANGFVPTETGPPMLRWFGTGVTTAQPNSDPTMAVGFLAGNAVSKFPGVESGLRPTAKAGLRSITAAFPAIKSVGGRGARPIASSDHPLGLAVDFMIPNYNSPTGRALGKQVAEYARANAAALHVKYIIYYEQKWSPGDSGWKPYRHPLGNSDTLAHRNHVHVSFKSA